MSPEDSIDGFDLWKMVRTKPAPEPRAKASREGGANRPVQWIGALHASPYKIIDLHGSSIIHRKAAVVRNPSLSLAAGPLLP